MQSKIEEIIAQRVKENLRSQINFEKIQKAQEAFEKAQHDSDNAVKAFEIAKKGSEKEKITAGTTKKYIEIEVRAQKALNGLATAQEALDRIMQENRTLGEKSKKINYIIAAQATTDSEISGKGNYNLFFENLNEFFSPGNPSKLSINKVLKSLGIRRTDSLQSIRLPGTTAFFRSADLDDMQIITWTKLQSMRLERRMKGKSKTIETSIKPMEESAQQLTFTIKPEIKYIQIFPCNLSDCIFDIQSNKMPKFISKIPGPAQHFIGKMRYQGSGDYSEALAEFASSGFTEIFESIKEVKKLSAKCWFIRVFWLEENSNEHIIDNLVINIPSQGSPAYVYHDINGYHFSDYAKEKVLTEQEFKLTIQKWFDESRVSDLSLYEATAGNEDYAIIKDEVIPSFWKQYIFDDRLLNAVLLNNSSKAHQLILSGVDLNAKNGMGENALIIAAFGNKTAIVGQLLKAGADQNITDIYGNTPLNIAARLGYLEVVEQLLKAKANPDIAGEYGFTPLMWAVYNEKLPVVEELLKAGANKNIKDESGFTALMWAEEKGFEEIAAKLR